MHEITASLQGLAIGAPQLHRTCLHATPIDGGWQCARHNKSLSEVDQRTACERHLYLPALIPGEQADAGEDWVEYVFPDGAHWRDMGINKTAGGAS